MKQNLLKRMGTESAKVIGGLTLGTALALTPNFAEACGNSRMTFWDVVKPIIANPEIEEKDDDGIIYIGWSSNLKALNEVNINPEKYVGKMVSTVGKERAFQKFGHVSFKGNNYIIGVDVNPGLRYGQVKNVFMPPTEDGRGGFYLEDYSNEKCLGAPLQFKSAKRKSK